MDSPFAGRDVTITPVIYGNARATHISENERPIQLVPKAYSHCQSLVVGVLENGAKVCDRRRETRNIRAEWLLSADRGSRRQSRNGNGLTLISQRCACRVDGATTTTVMGSA